MPNKDKKRMPAELDRWVSAFSPRGVTFKVLADETAQSRKKSVDELSRD